MPRSWKLESQKQFWQRRKDSGLCVECQKVEPAPGKLRCGTCLERRRAIHRKCSQKRRDIWLASGVCGDCGKPAVEGLKICQDCRDRRKVTWVNNRDRWQPIRKVRHQALKQQVFAAYGGAFCACCGETFLEFLSIDHINGDGAKDRRKVKGVNVGYNIYGVLKKQGFPPGFRVLCMNCNFALGHGGSCPHQSTQ